MYYTHLAVFFRFGKLYSHFLGSFPPEVFHCSVSTFSVCRQCTPMSLPCHLSSHSLECIDLMYMWGEWFHICVWCPISTNFVLECVQLEFASIPWLLRHMVQGFPFPFWNSQRNSGFQMHLGLNLFPCWSSNSGYDIQLLCHLSCQLCWWYVYIWQPLLITSPESILWMRWKTMGLYHSTFESWLIQFG